MARQDNNCRVQVHYKKMSAVDSEDEELLVKLGLDTAGFYGNQGCTCIANFDEILTTFRNETVNAITKSKMDGRYI